MAPGAGLEPAGLAAPDLRLYATHFIGQHSPFQLPPLGCSEADRAKAERARAGTLKAVALRYLKKHEGLRSIEERRQTFNRLILPKLGDIPIGDIRRKQITVLLDTIEENNGPVMADHALAYLRHMLNWYAIGDDDFMSPIVRGMARTKPKERARKRVLTEDELRAVWHVAGQTNGPFGPLVRFILLTATRATRRPMPCGVN